MKKLVSLFLSIAIFVGSIACADMSVCASTNVALDDIEIYKAQCFLGVAYDNNSNAVAECNKIYKYYINDDVFSPTNNFLDICYNDHKLMTDYKEWKLYSLAASPSSAIDQIMKKEDYYETLIISMYSKATAENDEFKKFINNKIIKDTNKLIGTFCDIAKVSTISELVDKLDIHSAHAMELIKEGVSKNYAAGIAGKMSSNLSKIISASNTIYDLSQRMSVYGAMAQLDDSTKLWLNQMYTACSSSNVDTALTVALMNLSMASTDFSGAVLADITSATFSFAKWAVKAAIDEGMKALIGSNPVVMAVFSGLKAGKTICNIFFNTDSICEQLYLMECIYEVEDLSRKVINECSSTFLNLQSLSNAQSFIYSVDCYFEAIINLDIDCMEKFLDELYNGGIIKGNANDYNEHIDVLEDLRNARVNNYENMILYFKAALKANFPDDYEYYLSDTTPAEHFTYTVENYGITITGLADGYNQTDLIIPSYIEGYPVKKIGNSAFNNCTRLISVTIPNSITEIDKFAFQNCSGLTSVTIPESVTYIGYCAFKYCKALKKITIPNSVTEIGSEAFWNCEKLTSITIPNSVTKIGSFAFCCCFDLISVKISNRMTYLSDSIFASCFRLTNVTIPDGITEIGENAFYNCISLTKISIPNSVIKIGMGAFEGCTYLTNVTIPDSVIYIDRWAFKYCSKLTSITIPNSVTEIGGNAFENCSELTSITIPESVISIGSNAFKGCANVKIYGYTGSYAETYAHENNIPFIAKVISLEDSNTNITVTGTIDNNVKLNVSKINADDVSIGDGSKAVRACFDITLTQNGKEVQPNDVVTVKIPYTGSYNNIAVYHINDNGINEEIQSIYDGEYITFVTNYFGKYAIVTEVNTGILGDVNDDGIVDIMDATYIQRYLANMSIPFILNERAADIDRDDEVAINDVTYIQRYLANMSDPFNIGKPI